MLPVVALISIEEGKKLARGFSKDASLYTLVADAFSILESLCTKELNSGELELELEEMELHRNEALDQDAKKTMAFRRLIYALNESINNTARVLVTRNGGGAGRDVILEADVKMEEYDLPSSSIPVPIVVKSPHTERLAHAVRRNAATPNASVLPKPRPERTEGGRRICRPVKRPQPLDEPSYFSPMAASAPSITPSASETAIDEIKTEVKEEPMDDSFVVNAGLNETENGSIYDPAKNSNEEFEVTLLKEEENLDDTKNESIEGMEAEYAPGSSNPPIGVCERATVMLLCPLCSHYKNKNVSRTLPNMKLHMKRAHEKSVVAAKLRVDCECGFTTQNLDHVAFHGSSCGISRFKMLKNEELQYPKTMNVVRDRTMADVSDLDNIDCSTADIYMCPFCTLEVKRSLRNLELHLKRRHDKTPRKAGLSFSCNCGYVSRTVTDAMAHKKKCKDYFITMNHPSIPQCPPVRAGSWDI